MNKKETSDFDIMFSVEHDGDPENIPNHVLMEALERRVEYLRNNLSDIREACGVVYTTFGENEED